MEPSFRHRAEAISGRLSKIVPALRATTISGSLVLSLLPLPAAAEPAAHGNPSLVGTSIRPDTVSVPAVCDRLCAEQRIDLLLRTWTYAREPGQTYDYRMCDTKARKREGAACRAIGLVVCEGVSVGVATLIRQQTTLRAHGPDVMIGAGHSFVNAETGGRRGNCYFAPNSAQSRSYPISYIKIGPLTRDARRQVIAGDYAVGLVDGGVGSRHGAIEYRTLPPDRLSELIAQGTRFLQIGFLPRLGGFVISDNGLPLNQHVPQLGAAERDQYRHSFNTVVGFSGGPQMIQLQGGYSVYCVQVNMLSNNGSNQDNRPFNALKNPSACTRIDGAFKRDIERAFDFARTGRTKAGSFERMAFTGAR